MQAQVCKLQITPASEIQTAQDILTLQQQVTVLQQEWNSLKAHFSPDGIQSHILDQFRQELHREKQVRLAQAKKELMAELQKEKMLFQRPPPIYTTHTTTPPHTMTHVPESFEMQQLKTHIADLQTELKHLKEFTT